MPSGRVHRKISKMVFGKSCKKTNMIIDYPVRFLGKKHRVLFHDPLSALAIGLLSEGYIGALSGILHFATDRYCSEHRTMKRLMEYLF